MLKIPLTRIKNHKLSGLIAYRKIMWELGLPNFYVLTGGALRTIFNPYEHINDYDIFILSNNHEDLFRRKQILEDILIKYGFKQVFKCPKGELSTFRFGTLKFQIINVGNTLYSSPENIFDNFDFHLCQMAYFDKEFYVSKMAIKSIHSKKLSIHRLTFPAATLKRIPKYQKYGYKTSDCYIEFCKMFADNIKNSIDMNLEQVYVD